jgi:Tfp pilus tip-associated adhesin PilY1
VVDVDNDGFIDTAYVGDLGGNMWRFKFCTGPDGPGCNIFNWSGGFFYKASSGMIRPIYTTAAVARASGSIWVFWGTGDKVDPTSPNAQERFYALSDNDRTTTYTISDLVNLGQNQSFDGSKAGWYLTLSGGGEKMLSNPAVFGGVVLFTTFTPSSGGDLCAQGGTGELYAMAIMPLVINGITYNPGAGLMSEPSNPESKDGGAKSVDLGTGIPGAPVISQPPAGGTGPTDIFVPISGAAGTSTEVITNPQLGDTPLTRRFRETSPRSQMLHWRDMRLTP